MAAIQDTKTQWTCVDTSGLRHEPKFTETAGVVMGTADNGYFTTSKPEVAAELQEKFPHMLITRHEAYAGNKARRTVNFTMPLTFAEMRERWERLQQETEPVAVVPQEEHAEQPTE
jgi:hypothetical protein